jgi:hypothetical protein
MDNLKKFDTTFQPKITVTLAAKDRKTAIELAKKSIEDFLENLPFNYDATYNYEAATCSESEEE